MGWDAISMDGELVRVEDDVAHVVKEISRLWPDLKVQYCPDPDPGDAPFRVVELCRDNVWRPVLSVWQLDNRLLDMLYSCDSYKVNILAQLDMHNAAVKAQQKEIESTWRSAAKDVLLSAFRSPKGRYTIPDTREGHEGEIIVIDDDPARKTFIKDYAETPDELD
jgi:hypothetical protein